jgi:translation initiation factor 1A
MRKKGKKNTKSRFTGLDTGRKLVLKEDGQEYAIISKILGCRKFTAVCFDGKSRIAIVRSKRLRIIQDMTVLVSLREFDDKTADIIHKYDNNEVRQLESLKEIPASSNKMDNLDNKNVNEISGDIGFDFEDI